MVKVILLLACLALAALPISGCKPISAARAPASLQPAAMPVADSPFPFEEVAARAGLNYRWVIAGKRPLTILQTIGNGCAFLDYDNDGNLDILLVGPRLALYRGDGHGHFSDVTSAAGLDRFHGHFLGCAVGDYDNDGYEDLYISGYQTGLLLHNESGKHFVDVTQKAGIKPQPWGTAASFVDIDSDGKLDLVIGNYVDFGPHTDPQLCQFAGVPAACGPHYYKPLFPTIYHNAGNGRFQDRTNSLRPGTTSGKTLGIACTDYNATGRQSVAFANDEMPGDLLENTGQSLKNVGAAAGVALDAEGRTHGGMGIDWGDYDNDGRLDLAVATFAHEPKNLYHNEGDGTFVDRSTLLGITEKMMPLLSFGVKFLDADNDGWLDLMFTNGHVQDNIAESDKTASYRQPCIFLHNVGGAHFEQIVPAAGSAPAQPIVGRGLAIGDYDNDGKMDALVVDSEGAPLLLHNIAGTNHHWLSVRLIGTKSNRDGIGALIVVESAGRKRLQRCATDGSYLSASDRRVHFGLGDAAQPVRVTVHWPNGHTDIFPDIAVDRSVPLREGNSRPHPTAQ